MKFTIPCIISQTGFSRRVILRFLRTEQILRQHNPTLQKRSTGIRTGRKINNTGCLPIIHPTTVGRKQISFVIRLRYYRLVLIESDIESPLLIGRYQFQPVLPSLRKNSFTTPTDFHIIDSRIYSTTNKSPLRFGKNNVGRVAVIGCPASSIVSCLTCRIRETDANCQLCR